MPETIAFQEFNADPHQWLQEIRDPALVRGKPVSLQVSVELRCEQLRKLRGNIDRLRAKQAEFHRRLEEYIENLQRLAASIEQGLEADRAKLGSQPVEPRSTHVHCVGCQGERIFERFEIVFARESEEAFNRPTECYVFDGSQLKKGVFRCLSCGSDSLTIRAK
jgi:hypothetical protein